MRTVVPSVAVLLIIVLSCTQGEPERIVADEVLDFYRQFSPYTDPGEYGYLYADLPEAMEDLCALIKRQLTHPLELGKLRRSLPQSRHFEDTVYVTVESMLGGLLERDREGLVADRRPEDRLNVACIHHATLFASMMKARGVPARLRCGWAPYIGEMVGRPELRAGHAICEVWSEKERRWILVDPDRRMVDIPRDKFEFPGDVWPKLRDGSIDKADYLSYRGPGDYATIHILCLDLRCVLNNEVSYWLEPPIVRDFESGIDDLDEEAIAVLDRLAELLRAPDGHLDELAEILEAHNYLQCNE
jgi:hypothetical protein